MSNEVKKVTENVLPTLPKFMGEPLMTLKLLEYFKPIRLSEEKCLEYGLLDETYTINPLTGIIEVVGHFVIDYIRDRVPVNSKQEKVYYKKLKRSDNALVNKYIHHYYPSVKFDYNREYLFSRQAREYNDDVTDYILVYDPEVDHGQIVNTTVNDAHVGQLRSYTVKYLEPRSVDYNIGKYWTGRYATKAFKDAKDPNSLLYYYGNIKVEIPGIETIPNNTLEYYPDLKDRLKLKNLINTGREYNKFTGGDFCKAAYVAGEKNNRYRFVTYVIQSDNAVRNRDLTFKDVIRIAEYRLEYTLEDNINIVDYYNGIKDGRLLAPSLIDVDSIPLLMSKNDYLYDDDRYNAIILVNNDGTRYPSRTLFNSTKELEPYGPLTAYCFHYNPLTKEVQVEETEGATKEDLWVWLKKKDHFAQPDRFTHFQLIDYATEYDSYMKYPHNCTFAPLPVKERWWTLSADSTNVVTPTLPPLVLPNNHWTGGHFTEPRKITTKGTLANVFNYFRTLFKLVGMPHDGYSKMSTKLYMLRTILHEGRLALEFTLGKEYDPSYPLKADRIRDLTLSIEYNPTKRITDMIFVNVDNITPLSVREYDVQFPFFGYGTKHVSFITYTIAMPEEVKLVGFFGSEFFVGASGGADAQVTLGYKVLSTSGDGANIPAGVTVTPSQCRAVLTENDLGGLGVQNNPNL